MIVSQVQKVAVFVLGFPILGILSYYLGVMSTVRKCSARLSLKVRIAVHPETGDRDTCNG
jgi:hypothetical protein